MGGNEIERLNEKYNRKFGWRIWRSVSGRWVYWHRPNTSPPDVRRYRPDQLAQLRAELAEREAQQRRFDDN
jgi:hypothetical protein